MLATRGCVPFKRKEEKTQSPGWEYGVFWFHRNTNSDNKGCIGDAKTSASGKQRQSPFRLLQVMQYRIRLFGCENHRFVPTGGFCSEQNASDLIPGFEESARIVDHA